MGTGKTALVLSGGGSLGAVQAGMLQALSGAGIVPDMVIGASVGALNAACYAEDPTPAGAERLAGIWRGLHRRDIFPLTWVAGLRALLMKRDHLVEAQGLQALIRRVLRIRRFEEARVPLHVVATDIMNGHAVTLSSGEIEPALLASTAVPVIFPQVTLDGHHLVDGGVADNTPIASAAALGAERIIVLPTGMTCAMTEPPRSMTALALHAISLQSMRQLDIDVERFAARARIVIVPPLCPLAVSVFDFTQTPALIERAARQTRGWLDRGGLDRTGPLHVPLAHHDHPRPARPGIAVVRGAPRAASGNERAGQADQRG